MKIQLYIAQLLPLILFYFFFAAPNELLHYSLTPLGRFVAIILILFYTSIHTLYGVLVCVAIVFYYQTDMVEGMTAIVPGTSCSIQSNVPSSVYDDPAGANEKAAQQSDQYAATYIPFASAAVATQKRKTNVDDEWDIFDWISPSPAEEKMEVVKVDIQLNNSDDVVVYENFAASMDARLPAQDTPSKVAQQLATQEELIFPKQSDDWIYRVWQTWFSDEHVPPVPYVDLQKRM